MLTAVCFRAGTQSGSVFEGLAPALERPEARSAHRAQRKLLLTNHPCFVMHMDCHDNRAQTSTAHERVASGLRGNLPDQREGAAKNEDEVEGDEIEEVSARLGRTPGSKSGSRKR